MSDENGLPGQYTQLSQADRERLEEALGKLCDVLHGEPADERDGWWLTSTVERGTVHVFIMHESRVVAKGYAHIKRDGQTDATMAQAFSYAAHMAYKHVMWGEEFGTPDETT